MPERKYSGTFVFVNPEAKNFKISDKYIEALNATRRGEVLDMVGIEDHTESGIIRIKSYINGRAYLDKQDIGEIVASRTKYYEVGVGNHTIEVIHDFRLY